MARIELRQWCLGISVGMLSLLLSGCGGSDGGGVVSTAPPPTYTKLADLSGDQTLQSASIHYTFANGAVSGPGSQAFGSGVVISYAAATDSYTLTAPDGTTAVFNSSSRTSSSSFSPLVSSTPTTFTSFNNNATDDLSVGAATANGVTLSYTAIGSWTHLQNGVQTVRLAVTGVPTIAGDMPKSGTANYQASVSGVAFNGGTSPYSLAANSTATFSADFAAGTVSTTLHLSGATSADPAPVALGSYTGTGNIASGTPGFSGSLAPATSGSDTATGQFSGAFFGPQAKEIGYAWYVANTVNGLSNFNAQGVVTGAK
jgi:hypothetical protein